MSAERSSSGDPRTETIAAWVRDLLRSWHGDTGSHLGQGAGSNPARFSSIYGLAAHAHESARAALLLIEHGMVLAAVPNVRAAYECGLTAQWLLRVEDGTVGFLREGHRQRRNMLATAKQVVAGWDWERADQIAAEFSHDPSTADDAARHLQKRCDDLQPGGQAAYLYYRALSVLSHASPYLVDYYLDLPEGANLPTLRKLPKDEDRYTWLHLLAMALVWAGRAVDACSKQHIRRSQLQAAARELAIPLDLRAAERVWVREQRDQQARRHQRRPHPEAAPAAEEPPGRPRP